MVVSSSLHGLIVADAFEIPNRVRRFEDGRRSKATATSTRITGRPFGRWIEPLVLREGVTVDGIAIASRPSGSPAGTWTGIVDELEMTTAVLRASAYGLCTI